MFYNNPDTKEKTLPSQNLGKLFVLTLGALECLLYMFFSQLLLEIVVGSLISFAAIIVIYNCYIAIA